MSLKDQLADDLTSAIREGDENRKTTLRLLITAIKNAEVAAMKPLDDPDVVGVITKQAKQRRESITEYEKAGRDDLVTKEKAELEVLQAYLPPEMSRDDVVAEAQKVVAELGATGPADKGKVMAALMPRLAGRVDGRIANEVVSEILSG